MNIESRITKLEEAVEREAVSDEYCVYLPDNGRGDACESADSRVKIYKPSNTRGEQ